MLHALRYRLLVLACLLLPVLAAHAQKIDLKGDVIMVDKKPYAKLKKSGSMLMRDYLLTSLDDKEVMLAKGNIVDLPSNERFIYYTLTFRPGGEVAEMSSTGLNFGQKLMEALVQQGVMRDGQADPEGVARFLKQYSEKFSEKYSQMKQTQLNTPPMVYKTVDRPRSAGVELRDNRRQNRIDITQGGKLIGYMPTANPVDGRVTHEVYLPDGPMIAVITIEAWAGGSGTMTYKILAKRDNTYHDRSASGGVEACRRDAVQWLVTGGLL